MRSANHSAPLQGLRLYKALLGLIQASGLAGGYDYIAPQFSYIFRRAAEKMYPPLENGAALRKAASPANKKRLPSP